MAKSTGKKKTTKKVTPDPKQNGTPAEPLSNFQEPKTGRGELKPPKEEKPPKEKKEEAPHKVMENDGSQIEFTKIILRDDHFATLHYLETEKGDQVPKVMVCEGPWVVHDKFKEAFAAFRIHEIVILEYIDGNKIKGEITDFQTPLLDKFVCNQVSLSNNRDGVTLSGHKKLYGKAVFNFNAPFKKFYESENGYPFATDLEIAWDDLCQCGLKYLNGTQRGKGTQIDLDFEGNPKKGKDKKTDGADAPYVDTGI